MIAERRRGLVLGSDVTMARRGITMFSVVVAVVCLQWLWKAGELLISWPATK